MAAPAAQGAPEIIQGSIRPMVTGSTLPLRVSATFVPTVSGSAEYLLQTETTWGAWSTLKSTGPATFEAGVPVSLGGIRDTLVTGARVCRKVPKGDTYYVSCSGETRYATGGVPRL